MPRILAGQMHSILWLAWLGQLERLGRKGSWLACQRLRSLMRVLHIHNCMCVSRKAGSLRMAVPRGLQVAWQAAVVLRLGYTWCTAELRVAPVWLIQQAKLLRWMHAPNAGIDATVLS